MKKLFCVLTVVCMLAMLVAVGSMSASAAEFNGDKDKVTPELLEAIEKSGEGDTLSVWLWYEDVTDIKQSSVADFIGISPLPGSPPAP